MEAATTISVERMEHAVDTAEAMCNVADAFYKSSRQIVYTKLYDMDVSGILKKTFNHYVNRKWPPNDS